MSVSKSKRRKRDKETTAKVNTPAENVTVYSTAVDLGSDNRALESMELELELAANADLDDAETVTLTLMEHDSYDADAGASDVQSNFTEASVNADLVQTGAGGSGSAVKRSRLRPTSATKRFIAVKVVTSASAGASVAGKNCQVSTRH